MKTKLAVHVEPDRFIEILNKQITEAEKDGYIIRDIKYQDSGNRYSAILMIVKLAK